MLKSQRPWKNNYTEYLSLTRPGLVEKRSHCRKGHRRNYFWVGGSTLTKLLGLTQSSLAPEGKVIFKYFETPFTRISLLVQSELIGTLQTYNNKFCHRKQTMNHDLIMITRFIHLIIWLKPEYCGFKSIDQGWLHSAFMVLPKVMLGNVGPNSNGIKISNVPKISASLAWLSYPIISLTTRVEVITHFNLPTHRVALQSAIGPYYA